MKILATDMDGTFLGHISVNDKTRFDNLWLLVPQKSQFQKQVK